MGLGAIFALVLLWQADAHVSGVAHYNARQYREAIADLQRAVETEAPSGAAWRESVELLGRSYYLAGRLLEAIPWLEKARRSTSRPAEVLYMLGNSYLQAHEPEKSRATFALMFGVEAGSAAAHLLNAQMMVRQELEEASEKELGAALELDPHLPGAHFLLGELALFHGDVERGIAELTRELSFNPGSAAAYWRLGDAYTRQERWDQAIPALEKSIWLNQTFSGPYILLGKAYLKKHDLANAEGVLRRAVQMDSQNSSAHYLLGQTLLAEGKAEEGKTFLIKSQELKKE